MRTRSPGITTIALVGGAAIVVALAGAGRAQPGRAGLGSAIDEGGLGSGAGVGSGSARPAGSSSVESSDVPPWQPSPARVAVAPFENHTTQKTSDWMIWGAPFELAEKTEAVIGLDPTAPPFFVGAAEVPADPGPVAAFAASQRADWVMTGWFDRVDTDQRLDVVLWKIAGGKATIAAESQRRGPPSAYHKQVGEALAEVWLKVGAIGTIDAARQAKLERALATDLYAVTLMGKGLGHLVAAMAMPPDPKPSPSSPRALEWKAAEHDLSRAVFIDPKCFEAQRLLGEYELRGNDGDPRAAARAAGKFNYASDLAPDDLAALRAAAVATSAAQKWEPAADLWRRLVTRKPWDLEARYALGAALWHVGEVARSEAQLTQVVAHAPDHLPARRVLALIHAARGDTAKLVAELEAIATRAPDDLDVAADLATAYGALGRWDRATPVLERLAAARPPDVALLVRVGDAHRATADLDGALAWYARAQRLAPESSYPGFVAAQAAFDAGKLADAAARYTQLQKYAADLPAAEQALGVIALAQGRADDAAWYLRRATREAPRSLATWRALIAAELARKDTASAARALEHARAYWPRDADLLYLEGVGHALANERDAARASLQAAVAIDRAHVAASALQTLDGGAPIALAYRPALVRPWGDAAAQGAALERFTAAQAAMAVARLSFQSAFLAVLGELGQGPLARPGAAPTQCPLSRIAATWQTGQDALARYARLGTELEDAYRYLARHDELGATAALLPTARTAVTLAKKQYRLALADLGELRAEWSRALGPELRRAGCTDRLLAAAVADPARYHVADDDRAPAPPEHAAPRPKPRATFYVDNGQCPDAVDVWIDGTLLGHVPPGRRSALVADGGERALCLIPPGGARCGDRGTVRQVYLHDGWSVTLHCPK